MISYLPSVRSTSRLLLSRYKYLLKSAEGYKIELRTPWRGSTSFFISIFSDTNQLYEVFLYMIRLSNRWNHHALQWLYTRKIYSSHHHQAGRNCSYMYGAIVWTRTILASTFLMQWQPPRALLNILGISTCISLSRQVTAKGVILRKASIARYA